MIQEVLKDWCLPALCAQIPGWCWAGILKVNLVTAYYHIVSNEDVSHVKYLYKFRSVEEFKDDLEVFGRRFRPISLQDLLKSIAGGRALPRCSLLLTFDDGFRENFDVIAPLLLQKGIPAAFFLTTAYVDNLDMGHDSKISLVIDHLRNRPASKAANLEIAQILASAGIHEADVEKGLLRIDYHRRGLIGRISQMLGVDFKAYLAKVQPYLNSEQIQKLIKMGFHIGSHSVDHPKFSTLALNEQLDQVRRSLDFLRERFSLNYKAFAFPHGDAPVGSVFFQEIFGKGYVDVTFGTSGIRRNPLPRHFHRFSMENSDAPAQRIIGRCYAKSIYQRVWAG